MEIKEKSRERMELRIYAQDTLRTVMEWMRSVKPSEWLPTAKEGVVSEDELKIQWRDYVDKGGKLMAKIWDPVGLLVDDMIGFMEEICAKPKNPPESK